MPPVWYASGIGMVVGEELDAETQARATAIAERANQQATDAVLQLIGLGVCPSQATRYNNQTHMMIGLVTATEQAWAAMLPLRLATDADPAIRLLAFCIQEALQNVSWAYMDRHLPYFDSTLDVDLSAADQLKVCAARIARVSYGQEGRRSADLRLGERLLANKHWSPFDQCAVWAEYNSLAISPLCCLPEDVQFGGGWNSARTHFDSTPVFHFRDMAPL